jgi:ketosteroid isomerase-like protein
MRYIFLLSVIASLFTGCANPVDHPEIRAVLDSQVRAWNSGDLEGFMAGYWKSEEMLFSTPKSQTTGWQATLDRYRAHYPTGQAMGRLRFEQLQIAQSAPEAAEVSGRYVQQTPEGLKTGRFFLTFRRMDNRWVIVHDHTTPDE